MNIERLNNGYSSRYCPAASDEDKASCKEPNECFVTELSTPCQPLFTGSKWDAVAWMSYRVHFVEKGTITFVVKSKPSPSYPFYPPRAPELMIE
jgi:hypothetical protein